MRSIPWMSCGVMLVIAGERAQAQVPAVGVAVHNPYVVPFVSYPHGLSGFHPYHPYHGYPLGSIFGLYTNPLWGRFTANPFYQYGLGNGFGQTYIPPFFGGPGGYFPPVMAGGYYPPVVRVVRPLIPPMSAPPLVGPDVARLTFKVPAEAEVWVGDEEVGGKGSTVRVFETERLDPGEVKEFAVKVRWQVSGQALEQTRSMVVQAGDAQSLLVTGN